MTVINTGNLRGYVWTGVKHMTDRTREQIEQENAALRRELNNEHNARVVAEEQRRMMTENARSLQIALRKGEARLAVLEAREGEREALREALAAARDTLAAFAKQAGYLPEQGAYSTRMTEGERRLAEAVACIDALLVPSSLATATPTDEEDDHARLGASDRVTDPATASTTRDLEAAEQENAALRRELGEETELRRKAQAHVRLLQAALDEKPYADEYEDVVENLKAAEARLAVLEALLKRLRGWDMMDATADGPYWRREIDAALLAPSSLATATPNDDDDAR